MKTIRASEVSSYLYCRRAWWYQLQGVKPENQAELVAGSELHARHGRALLTSGCLTSLAYALLILAVVALAAWLVGQVT